MKLNKFSIVFVFLLSLSLFSCSDDDKIDNPGFASIVTKNTSFGLGEGEVVSKVIDVYTSNIVGTDRTFEVVLAKINTDSTTASVANYTLSSVTVPANSNKGELVLALKNTNLAETGEQQLIINLAPLPGVGVGDPIRIKLNQVCNLNTVVFSLTLDAYGSETTWALYSGTDEVPLFSGGPYTDGGTAGSQTWCLPNGDYTFLIEDVYGDGIAPAGSYKITKTFADGSPSVVLASGGAFASFETKTFTLN